MWGTREGTSYSFASKAEDGKLDLELLKYRRQYLLAPYEQNCPFRYRRFELHGSWILYAHTDLPVESITEAGVQIVLLGDLFDYREPHKDNQALLRDLHDADFNVFLQRIAHYTGRYVLLHLKEGKLRMVGDATAARKVYYYREGEEMHFASQPHLLASVIGLDRTSDPSRQKFYRSAEFDQLDTASIGDTTCYDEIRQLIPNHYLDAGEGKAIRFWPDKEIRIRPVNEVAEECAELIRGYVEAITNRYRVMLPVTAGFDSRLLLAATRNITEKIYYYINLDPDLSMKSADVRVPRRLLKRLGLTFHELILPYRIPDAFLKVYWENNPLASKRYEAHAYNYFNYYQDRVNLPGNFASAPWGFYKLIEKNVSGETLAHLYELSEYEHAIEYYTRWLDGCRDVCRKYHMNTVRLFYWEERIANWGTQIQLDKDIAQEEINPFNSKLLLEKFLAVETYQNNIPDYILHRRIIQKLWPETLKAPINPSFSRYLLKFLTWLGLLDLILMMKYKSAR
jgi:hypothetical protein